MAIISLRQLLDHAAEYSYGVPAFNVNNLEQTRAIMEAADATDSPVIMQASAGARKVRGSPLYTRDDGGCHRRISTYSRGYPPRSRYFCCGLPALYSARL